MNLPLLEVLSYGPMQLAEGNGEEQTVTQATYLIGRAAEASGVSIKAIRYYEEIGLIPKVPRRNNVPHGTGHRVFSVADVGRLKFIHHARLLGLSLAEVGVLLAVAEEQGCPENKPEYREVFGRHLNAIPVAAIPSPSKAPKTSAAGFRKTPAAGPCGRVEADQFDTGNARMMAP